MNSFGSWWDKTITVYNKYIDQQTRVVRWYRYVLHNTFWKAANNKITIGKVQLETDDIICRIPIDVNYLPKHIWINIPNDQMSKYFTLGVGDIIVLDEVDDEINEYVSEQRSTDLVKKYKELQGCFVIKSWSDNTGNRGNEHYFASGS